MVRHMTTITLPPLPEPLPLSYRGDVGYTADQLRADRLAVAQAVIEACAAVCDADPLTVGFLAAKNIRAIQIEVNDADR